MDNENSMKNSVTMRMIKEQSNFCKQLMDKLCLEINGSGFNWNTIDYHHRKQDDIKRIRRELMELSKMLDPYEY